MSWLYPPLQYRTLSFRSFSTNARRSFSDCPMISSCYGSLSPAVVSAYSSLCKHVSSASNLPSSALPFHTLSSSFAAIHGVTQFTSTRNKVLMASKMYRNKLTRAQNFYVGTYSQEGVKQILQRDCVTGCSSSPLDIREATTRFHSQRN